MTGASIARHPPRRSSRLARIAVVVLAVIGLLSLLGAIGLGIVAANAVRRGFSARAAPSSLEAMAARTARGLSMRGAASLKDPLPSSPEVVAAGRAHWADHCAVCHGNDGGGQTEMGPNLYPKAPDMRLEATQSLSDGELFAVITNGVRLTGMPAWGEEHGDARETWALVQFIRHLPALTSEEMKQMERLNPKGPDEMNEAGAEEKFLEGADKAPPARTHGH